MPGLPIERVLPHAPAAPRRRAPLPAPPPLPPRDPSADRRAAPALTSAPGFIVHLLLAQAPALRDPAPPLQPSLDAYRSRLAEKVRFLGLLRPIDLIV